MIENKDIRMVARDGVEPYIDFWNVYVEDSIRDKKDN